jgi:hypothetical protein
LIIDILGWYVFIGLIISLGTAVRYVIENKMKLNDLTFNAEMFSLNIFLWPVITVLWLRDLLFNRV